MATTAQNSTCCVVYDLFQKRALLRGMVNGVVHINFNPHSAIPTTLNDVQRLRGARSSQLLLHM
jgi:hypothetical protein